MLKAFASSMALLGISALALTLASCDGAQGGGACGTAIAGPPTLMYPISGATAVPDNASDLIIEGVVVAGATYTLTSSTAPTIVGGSSQALPSPLPTPISLGTPQEAIPIAGLAAHTTYSVGVSSVSSNSGGGCGLPQIGGTIGTFTTQ